MSPRPDDKRPAKREQRAERPERFTRTSDIDHGDHFLIGHKILEDGKIICACREIEKLRTH